MRLIRLSCLLLALTLAGCVTVSTTPSPEQQAHARQAQNLFHDGHYAQAAQAYAKLAAQNRGTRDYFLLRAAEAWRENGSPSKTAQALADIQRDQLQPADARHYDLLEAEIALEHGDAPRALTLTKGPHSALPDALQARAKIGRASGRERVWTTGGREGRKRKTRIEA